MNKLIKIFVAILGAANILFSMFIPIAVAILWTLKFGIYGFGSYIILFLAIATTFYRGLKVWVK